MVFGLIKSSVSESLWFHLGSITTPHKVWYKLEYVFDKFDTMRDIQIDAQLSALYPDDYPIVIDYLTRFKELYTQLLVSGKNKKEKPSQMCHTSDCLVVMLGISFQRPSVMPWIRRASLSSLFPIVRI